ncbi:MAG: metalloregulator ArsR/SmtB family transcription factor [Coprobacillus sp.]|nr:metalloregulator ArsR/SmtB family transcription factor [Coprobacillus sp.]
MAKTFDDDTLTKVSQLLSIAADETRLRILLCLSDGEKCVKMIQDLIGASQSLVSHQLAVLKNYKLVDSRREGNNVFYFLTDEHIFSILDAASEHVME